jgi:hypothetical protein
MKQSRGKDESGGAADGGAAAAAALFALAAVFLSLFGLKPWWPALLAGALLPAACAALPDGRGRSSVWARWPPPR